MENNKISDQSKILVSKESVNAEHYYSISQNKCKFFNFFYENQYSLGWIIPSDYNRLMEINSRILTIRNQLVFSGIGLGISFRHLIMPYMLKWKIKRFNIPISLTIYYLGGVFTKSIGEIFLRQSHLREIQQIQSKYNFGFEDFTRAIEIVDKCRMRLHKTDREDDPKDLKAIQDKTFDVKSEFSRGEDRTDLNDTK